MKLQKIVFSFLLLTLILPVNSCHSQNDSNGSVYTFKSGSFDGIGKWYKGREISHVMGYQGMSWLERSEREQEEETSTLLKNMNLKSKDVVADIGAGSGYHVFKIAPKVSEGKVYAVDIQQEMLNAMEKKKNRLNQTNIELIKGTEKSTKLPENAVDKVLMVDVYHEFEFPVEMMASIKRGLKPNGKIYLIEYRAEDPQVPIKRLHKMSEAQAVKEMRAAGFELIENIDNLPWQHCMVFGMK
ncbi:class I SAM-dependent methyltransferase [Psychroflexus sp. CAK8W]|uniref:Class I SAM-dependent methyltransferase n=1 Tax=Psychroflexus longus TaxID=2873596 RepID=A0ABS7XK51_9FLAO|nr:class I SAM-dependent methyltransferase [Psychroflexus longus]MBZ9779369.1 class I SAM-dependent methyltransferase [Psychroflexus longus]